MVVRQNSLKAWILAARPKTLAGAAAPVLTGAALSWATIRGAGGVEGCIWIIPAIICLLFALVMQINANFINDYFDFKKGADSEERLGPERACSQGWISPRAMKTGIWSTTILSVIIGLPLIYFGGRAMLIVGILCIAGAFLYTTKLSYLGWGDLMVFVYFGVIPVFFTWFVSTRSLFTLGESCFTDTFRNAGADMDIYRCSMGKIALAAGLATGFIIDNLLIVNNYRDRELDRKNRKKTLVVRFGSKAAEWMYLLNGCFSVAGMIAVGGWLKKTLAAWDSPQEAGTFPLYLAIPLLFLPPLFLAHRKMVRINNGAGLNECLGDAAKNILIFSILFIITIFLSAESVWYNG